MNAPVAARRTWRDTLRAFADVALIGFGVTLAALPLVTAGAAVAAGSATVHHWCTHDELPPARTVWRWFTRSLLPGLCATVTAALITALLAANVAAIRLGVVPGGTVALWLTAAAAGVTVGLAGIFVVRLGQHPNQPWRTTLRSTVPGPHTTHGWGTVAACAGVLVLAALLTVALPVTTPLLTGFTLLALHATAHRTSVGASPRFSEREPTPREAQAPVR